MPSVSVVIPVKDGNRYLTELLGALRRWDVETLVIDSGSRDRSVATARAAGVEVIEVAPDEFGHGRTRNLGAERTSGELICFLTQDATPVEGWLEAYLEAFELDERVGAAFGPHLPREGTSPMIARELVEFFGGFSPDGQPAVQRQGDAAFLSNVNACYRRACWEEIRFRELSYSEDQAFGRDMLERRWLKVYHPGAAVLHAHDYGAIEFMRRYFDEYRGLRGSIGHVEPFGVRSAAQDVSALVARDRQWMAEQGWEPRRRAAWTGRALLHHSGRKAFSALGSRAGRLPAPVQQAISLEGTAVDPTPSIAPSGGGPQGRSIRGWVPRYEYETVTDLLRDGPVPLDVPVPGMSSRKGLHVALLIPTFARGSGGHYLLMRLLLGLERMGHTCSLWHVDPLDEQPEEAEVLRHAVREHFAPVQAPLFKGFDRWYGADVALATGWQTVYALLQLDHCRARAYVVNDHEPEFYPTSFESWFAEESYRQGLYCIAGSPWLADLMRERYGARASEFEYGVDHETYWPRPVERRRDTVVFYARAVTPRRAVTLGIKALEELKRRRPSTRIVLFGDSELYATTFDYDHVGVATPDQLSWMFSEATVGMTLSMTNFSLIPKEMMACGLPVVELATPSARSVFGADGPIELAPFDPYALADAVELLLDEEELWTRRSEESRRWVGSRTWEAATSSLEAGIRAALREREEIIAALEVDLVAPDPPTQTPATDRLVGRLSEEDVEEVRRRLSPEHAAPFTETSDGGRRHLTLAFGVHHGVDPVLAKTGLVAAEPPEEVHAMSRGAYAAGGAYYDADFVVESLAALGAAPGAGERWLDFGCSSGRVIRVLAAAYPEVEWHGCDPIEPAVRWASESLPGVHFLRSPQSPALPYQDESFDTVYAISIWSHFAQHAALRWLSEMHRIIRPGGHLLLTTHGPNSVAYYARAKLRPRLQLEEIATALHDQGYWYAPEFGERGDHGITDAEWGTAFLTPEWLADHAGPSWTLEATHPARNAGNQDVLVFERR